ncbi:MULTISPECIES: PAS domain-containing sensor histidine kinase [unclassified Saccharopolyspora]|uniref:PAS domain-containing sensor histidine kinase n=1 Tax=unclassified Saccharopolyspora TaxID=2646250 RepID=UPI001CD27BC7|nr:MULTISPECIES: PAS domain-containing sensor histidine kinase [unclassified Saccharopolyspora]MCA1189492.1 PAS domain-containing sensor histidine kinase [Saccharopolyspora sp. 6T]MCA1195354.1 PAS domain-containing sensor histidine kinase [Saccharopolyspora sp. 6V]MCA1228543.1 PAS domain-containing sensor histidine kinase [Saccharopolyspora sp. 6M]MCA1279265.1 PAS domain-containing sensor histidine kinase [Saccharopolyspora sp. 7B]
MSTLSDLLAEHTGLSGAAADHLQLVVAEWQLLSDLSFADFLLWVPVGPEDATEDRFLCVAQARPTTAPTAHPEDVVSTEVTPEEHPQLRRAALEGRICREEDPRWHLGVPVRRETIPVKLDQEIVAVLSRDTNLAVPRVPSPLEISYLGSAADLCQMIADGTFPTPEPAPDVHTSPRVGDGLVRVDASGTVVFASPNALSAYHRMGHAADLVGVQLAPLTRSLLSDPFDADEVAQRVRRAVSGEPSMRMEAEAKGATVLFRALPLQPRGQVAGALVLVRDVTEVKRRDRALMSKDATIREIHHRVKNNLQTVAALLRLQSRRTGNSEARLALDESVRRVTSIALVHETLSMSVDERVDLDDVVDRVIPMMSDVAVAETGVKVSREGRFGVVSAELATPLVMVLTELVQNAFEHAFPEGTGGEVVVQAERSARWLDVVISDDGQGLPKGFSLERAERLGLQIVRTLVESELRGSLSLRGRGRQRGTEAVLRVPLKYRR